MAEVCGLCKPVQPAMGKRGAIVLAGRTTTLVCKLHTHAIPTMHSITIRCCHLFANALHFAAVCVKSCYTRLIFLLLEGGHDLIANSARTARVITG